MSMMAHLLAVLGGLARPDALSRQSLAALALSFFSSAALRCFLMSCK